ncbi:MAG: hypothetical protein WC823_04490 [Parcubacteria group bacterium]|jgi:hypothetical protein
MMKRIFFSLMLLFFYAVFPIISFADDAPTFPPTLPFTYNGITYYNVLSQVGQNSNACGGYKTIRLLTYYNRTSASPITTTTNYYNIVNGAATYSGINQSIAFTSMTQDGTIKYTVTPYTNPSGVSIGGGQCWNVSMNPDSLYSNNDILKPGGTLFKAANVVSPRLLSVNIYPLEGGSVTSDGIACDFLHLGNCQNYFGQNGDAIITASANPGYVLSYVQDGAIQSVDNPYTATMDKDRPVTVVFKSAWDWLLNPSTMPYFPPRVPFIYNGKTYYNVMAQIGQNSNACGGYKTIRQIVYYNKSTSNTPPLATAYSNGIVYGFSSSGITQSVMFSSFTQNDSIKYTITEYTNPSSVSISGGQCYGYPLNPNLVYVNNDIMKSDGTLFKAANVASPVKLSITASGGSVTGEGISCNVNTSGNCLYYAVKGSVKALHADPKPGWEFDHWDDGVAVIIILN